MASVASPAYPDHLGTPRNTVTPAPTPGCTTRRGINISDGHPGHSDTITDIKQAAWQRRTNCGVPGQPSCNLAMSSVRENNPNWLCPHLVPQRVVEGKLASASGCLANDPLKKARLVTSTINRPHPWQIAPDRSCFRASMEEGAAGRCSTSQPKKVRNAIIKDEQSSW